MPRLKQAARGFGALLLTGPRRSGKTTLLRRAFPRADYRLLEDPDVRSRAHTDPRGFLDSLRLPVILDEIQHVPDLMAYIRTRIDMAPGRKGRYLMTGSQEAPLMRGVTESMAGRVGIFALLPFSLHEHPDCTPFAGGFPEVLAQPQLAQDWFRSYLQTYLERDVRTITAVRDIGMFRRFLGLLAARVSQEVNLTALAGPLGLSLPGVRRWLDILEITGHVILAQPYFENFGKRIVKTPRVYFGDTGLVCHLLGIESAAALERSSFLGPVFENFVALEIVKAQINHGRRRELYWLRDHHAVEVDFVVPAGGGHWALVEAKATRTVLPAMAGPIRTYLEAAKGKSFRGWVVHRGARLSDPGALGGGVTAVPVEDIPGRILGVHG